MSAASPLPQYRSRRQALQRHSSFCLIHWYRWKAETGRDTTILTANHLLTDFRGNRAVRLLRNIFQIVYGHTCGR